MANGQISVLYSPSTSTNGAKLLASKGPPRKLDIEDIASSLLVPPILTPHALPMFRDGEVSSGIAGTKRKRDKERADPRKSRRPELPVNGPGKGGRVGASATQHVVRHLVRDTTRDEDVSSFYPYLPSPLLGKRTWMLTMDLAASRGVAQVRRCGRKRPAMDWR